LNDPLPPVAGEAGGGVFGSTGLALSVFFRWMAVIGLVYIAFIFFRKWQGNKSGQPQRRIKVVDRFHFSPKQALYLVNVDGREFLLGSTDSTISLITEMSSVELMEVKPGSQMDFESLLRNKKDTMDETNHE
jgi:flagellar biosynthetic protein FliO